jgi:hypothetical protein
MINISIGVLYRDGNTRQFLVFINCEEYIFMKDFLKYLEDCFLVRNEGMSTKNIALFKFPVLSHGIQFDKTSKYNQLGNQKVVFCDKR